MRKRLGLIALGIVGAMFVAGGYLYWAAHQIPEFYRELNDLKISPSVRKAEAKKFTQRTLQLVDDVRQSRNWTHEFTQRQINSWFVEELNGQYADLLPEKVTEPRVKITNEAVLIGFRYEQSGWSGVVSLRIRPWVPRPNQLALEILSVKAGSLPVPLDAVLQELQRSIATRGWRVDWRQSEGNDVLLIDFSSTGRKYSVLEKVTLLPGKVRVSGRQPD